MIYTFYSYKGGVGRTMALANVAELFCRAGLKVLMVDWDLEAPGLERFFPLDLDDVLDHSGVMDMLLRYKQQMSRELPVVEGQELPFERPIKLAIDIYGNSPTGGKLHLLTAGRRSKDHFSKYANAVLTFDWQDFYRNWEGEAYFEWLRRQFEEMSDVVLIDSRTGLTEMGGVCIYQLADVVVMFCTANQQSIDGTYRMLLDLKRPQVEELRGHPLEFIIVPARIEDAESDFLDEFQRDFVRKFSQYTPEALGATSNRFWQLAIPYVPRYAYKETIAVRERGKASAEELIEAFSLLTFSISRLAPMDSPIRSALPETRTKVDRDTLVHTSIDDIQIVFTETGDSVVIGKTPVTVAAADHESALDRYLQQVSDLEDWPSLQDSGNTQHSILIRAGFIETRLRDMIDVLSAEGHAVHAVAGRIRSQANYLIHNELVQINKLVSGGLDPSTAKGILRSFEDEFDALSKEFLDFIAGAVLRQNKIGDEICRFSDALLREIGAQTGDGWTGTTVLADRDIIGPNSHLVRIPFSNEDIWSLPFVVHQYAASTSITRNIATLISFTDSRNGVWSVLAADMLATHLVGPAYAFAAAASWFSPWHSLDIEHGESSLLWDLRFQYILWVLEQYREIYAREIEIVKQAWHARQADDRRPTCLQDKKRIDDASADELYKQVVLLRYGASVNHGKRKGSARYLVSCYKQKKGVEGLEQVGLVDVINAAWYSRMQSTRPSDVHAMRTFYGDIFRRKTAQER